MQKYVEIKAKLRTLRTFVADLALFLRWLAQGRVQKKKENQWKIPAPDFPLTKKNKKKTWA